MIFVKKICEQDTIGGHFIVELYYFYKRYKRKHELKARFSKFFKILYGFRWNLLLKALMKMRVH